MVKNKRYKKYINQKGFLKLPMFRKLIVLTAPNGETVPRDFYIEEKVTQVVDSTDSNIIPNAITVETVDGDFHIVISDNFEKSKNSLKLLAEKEDVSVFWLDKEMLEIQGDDDEDDIIEAIALEGVRKWIYCPYIAESYNEWVELVVRDVGNAAEYQIENEDVVCASTIEFAMRDPDVLPDVIYQQFNIRIETLLDAFCLESSESQRQILCAAIIIIQGIIGWYMVKSGLTDRTDVSHYQLSLHLTLAFIIFILLFWNYLKYKNQQDFVYYKKIPSYLPIFFEPLRFSDSINLKRSL